MRKGGTARSIRYLTVLCAVLTLCLVWVFIRQKKENYRGLWDKVNNHEQRIKRLEK